MKDNNQINYKFPFMTDKMQMLYMDIVASLEKLPDEQRGYIFGYENEEDIEWVVAVAQYITFEFIKYSFDCNDKEHSLRYFLKDADESERMLQSRIMQYVLKYKMKEIESKIGEKSSIQKYANADMNTIEKKLRGHKITEMNFFENQNVHDLALIKAIVERRIVSSKKVSNTQFQEMFEEYDTLVESLIERSKKSDADMVFSTIALFTLEWHYPIEAFYYLSCIMEDEDNKIIDQEMLLLICGMVEIESRFGGVFSTDSRMVKERMIILPYLFGKNTNKFACETLKDLIKEIIVLCVKYNEILYTEEGELYKEWFRKESTMCDWASFFRYYDIFSIWEKKEWTRTKIQNMRYLFDLVLQPKC